MIGKYHMQLIQLGYSSLEAIGQHKALLWSSNLKRTVLGTQININDVPRALVDMLRTLQHPNVGKVIECLNVDNQTVVVIEERPPENVLARRYAMMREAVLNIMKGLALGLHYLQVKRRIAPLSLDPNTYYVVDGEPLIRWTSILGNDTEEFESVYTAPETRQGVYGYESAIWSLGVIFLELSTGKRIADELSKESVTQEHLQQLALDIEDAALRQLIGQMLSVDCSQRPTTEKILIALGIGAGPQPPTPSEIVNEDVRRIEMYRLAKITEQTLRQFHLASLPTIHKEAQRGNPKAMFLMGIRFGREPEISKKEAMEWSLKAIECGDVYSYHSLYMMEDDQTLSRFYVTKGSEMGDVQSIYKLGRCYGYGQEGISKDVQKGLAILRSLPPNYTNSKLDLARMVAQQKGLVHPLEPQKGVIDIYKEGADLGDWKAIQNLSVYYYRQGNYMQSIQYAMIEIKLKGIKHTTEYDLKSALSFNYIMLADRLSARRWEIVRRAEAKSAVAVKQNVAELF